MYHSMGKLLKLQHRTGHWWWEMMKSWECSDFSVWSQLLLLWGFKTLLFSGRWWNLFCFLPFFAMMSDVTHAPCTLTEWFYVRIFQWKALQGHSWCRGNIPLSTVPSIWQQVDEQEGVLPCFPSGGHPPAQWVGSIVIFLCYHNGR